jgi:hypothetical protein
MSAPPDAPSIGLPDAKSCGSIVMMAAPVGSVSKTQSSTIPFWDCFSGYPGVFIFGSPAFSPHRLIVRFMAHHSFK